MVESINQEEDMRSSPDIGWGYTSYTGTVWRSETDRRLYDVRFIGINNKSGENIHVRVSIWAKRPIIAITTICKLCREEGYWPWEFDGKEIN